MVDEKVFLAVGSANAAHDALEINHAFPAGLEGPGPCAHFSAMFATLWPLTTPVEKDILLKCQRVIRAGVFGGGLVLAVRSLPVVCVPLPYCTHARSRFMAFKKTISSLARTRARNDRERRVPLKRLRLESGRKHGRQPEPERGHRNTTSPFTLSKISATGSRGDTRKPTPCPRPSSLRAGILFRPPAPVRPTTPRLPDGHRMSRRPPRSRAHFPAKPAVRIADAAVPGQPCSEGSRATHALQGARNCGGPTEVPQRRAKRRGRQKTARHPTVMQQGLR